MGSDRYSYSFNDPINLMDLGGNEVETRDRNNPDEQREIEAEEDAASFLHSLNDPELSFEEKQKLFQDYYAKYIEPQYGIWDSPAHTSAIGVGAFLEAASKMHQMSQIMGDNNLPARVGLAVPKRSGVAVSGTGKPIEFDGQFYSADGFKFSSSYYDRLWSDGGRPAPFSQARSIKDSNPKITLEPRGAASYFRYDGAGMEMIYNPTTGQVGHIQPLR